MCLLSKWKYCLPSPTPHKQNQQFRMLIFSCECRDAVNGRAVLVDCSGISFAVVVVAVAEPRMLLQHGV